MSRMQGVFIPVVGPSGAGKDSIMEYARLRLADAPGIHFARRVITRPSDPHSEKHDTHDEAGFLAAERAGGFALSWRSHGLFYGIPVQVEERLQRGEVVIANLSRASVEHAAARFKKVRPVLLKVSQKTLAARLAARGRETEDQITARLARSDESTGLEDRCHVIDNDGTLEEAGEKFVAFLRSVVNPK